MMRKRFKFYKNDLVRPAPSFRSGFIGWKALADSEIESWREKLHQDILAGRILPHDDAGESHLPPRTKSVEVFYDRVYCVMKGRVRVPHGFSTSSAVEIFDFTTGETIWVSECNLEHI